MADVLETLLAEGRKLGIVTAKRRRSIDLAFRSVDLERFFGAIVTADDATRHKPDPEPVYVALERLGSRPEDTAFVGDSPFDMGAGKAAGVYAVGVSWGGLHQEERLREAGADVVVHSTRGAPQCPLSASQSCASSWTGRSTSTTSSTTPRSPTPSTTSSTTSS